MSYSFGAQAPTKREVIEQAEEKFRKVVHDMPIHGKDQSEVLAHMRNLVNLAAEPKADEHVYVTMSGYMVATNPTAGPSEVTTVSANVSVSIARPMPAGNAAVRS